MLVELAVRDLGVIEDLHLVLGPGMTALTGETGAGKTLVVDAIELLVGGRADPAVVRAGAAEAWVEGRFVVPATDTTDEREIVLARAIPAAGRSRAYVDGRLATIATLVEWGAELVDLHGQHAHQSLLAPAVQRSALDRYAGIDLAPLTAARARVRELDAMLASLGGDDRARAREIDLLAFQVEELAAAAISGPDEDLQLDAEETLLADAVAHQEAAAAAVQALAGDGGAADRIAEAVAALTGRPPFAELEGRLRSAGAERTARGAAGPGGGGGAAGAAPPAGGADVRARGEAISEDPQRLDAVRSRRQLLADLRRKYGQRLEDVLAYADEARARLAELHHHDERAASLDADRRAAIRSVASAAAAVAAARRSSADALAAAVQAHLGGLAMPRAHVEVAVDGDDPADDVSVLLTANPGVAPLPLSKVASGGELARTMLALRLVLTAGPPTLIFDEVDAGIGGEAAVAVGRSLASLGGDHQVLVVTHLPQVAAFAHAHVRVTKQSDEDHTVAHIEVLDEPGRVAELSRMLSGQPESQTARDHAQELLATASRQRGEGR